jgi:hypothetical protein
MGAVSLMRSSSTYHLGRLGREHTDYATFGSANQLPDLGLDLWYASVESTIRL